MSELKVTFDPEGHSSPSSAASESPTLSQVFTPSSSPAEGPQASQFTAVFHGSVIYELALAMDTCLLPIYLYKIKSYAADLQHPLKGAQGGVQKRVTLCLELVGSGMARQVFRDDFMSPILVSPHI